MALELRNPHSVLAALATRPQDVIDVRLSANKPSPAWDRVVDLARQHGVPVRQGQPYGGGGGRQARKQAAEKSARTGGGQATVKERQDVLLKDLFKDVTNRAGGCGLWLALDCLQDPHNVGAVFRSAAFFGVQGVVVTKDRSAPINATVYDVATGGLEHVPFAVQGNLSRALSQAKKAGLWVLGASEHAEQDVSQMDRDRPWLLVLGNEERGLRHLTLQNCDATCKLSARGPVSSLNVSVAAGVLMACLTGTGV